MAYSSHSLTFYDFLDRMRHPASLDLVRSIKNFIVSFSFSPPNSENDSKRLQDFFLAMEASIRDHSLWAGASEEEIDCAIEGLEKYVMTKLFTRTFSSSPEDAKIDQEISEKIHSLQNFIRPEHLDIRGVFHNAASWLLAEKELQKINAFKAPREKLLCILNCCRVINNLLLNVSMSTNCKPAGADDFLPVLIYITIKANPPQLHSNLKFIQLYRRQSKLISEAAYYFTNLISVKSFIVDLDAKSLSMDETEFQESMQKARLASEETRMESRLTLEEEIARPSDPFPSIRRQDMGTSIGDEVDYYPFMETEPGELTVGDVERLLSLYKEVVRKYSRLSKSVRGLPPSKQPSTTHLEEANIAILQPKVDTPTIEPDKG